MMDRDTAMLLLLAGTAAVGIFLLSPWSPLTAAAQQAAPEGWEGTTWSPLRPRVPYFQRGGLYHPPLPGAGRSQLILQGWDWIASPPSEVTGPGVQDG